MSNVLKIINILYIYMYVYLILAYFFAIVLEVYQFARDAAVAEAWLIAQEPYLMSQELGVSNYFCKHKYRIYNRASFFKKKILFLQHTIDEVENLIKKHEAFEKSAAAQEERFSALHRLTTVSSQIHSHFYVIL